MGQKDFDLIIVGGGISGACLLWDSTLRGMNTLLLEKGDFASGTTQATSKLIHGGLRYLKNFEFGLVRESLRERRLLGRLAPHSVRPMPFLHAIYKGAKPGRLALGVGLWLYDLLSFDRNRSVPAHLRLPRHRWLSREEALAEEPTLRPDGLEGAFLYYDYQNVNPERLCCEFIFSAIERGAHARNYTEVTELRYDATTQTHTVRARAANGANLEFTSKAVINAAGPWADLVDRKSSEGNQKRIVRSMGIHLITKKISGDHVVALHRKDGSHYFVIQWRNHSLIGTTDFIYEGHPDGFKIPEDQILGLIRDVNGGLNVQLKRKDVQATYGGLRPLVEESNSLKGTNSYSASRKTEIELHPDRPGFFTVLGGKYTTSRSLAETTIDVVTKYLGGNWKKCETRKSALRTGDFEHQTLLKNKLLLEKKYNRDAIQSLIARYGLLAERMLNRHEDGVAITLENGELYYRAEVAYVLENEMVRLPADLFLRRTGLGTAGDACSSILDGTGSDGKLHLSPTRKTKHEKNYHRNIRIAG